MNGQDALFLVTDGGKTSYSYSDMLQAVARQQEVPEYVGRSSLFDFYVHLVAAMIHNLHIVILDADFSDAEIATLIGDLNTTTKCYPTQSMPELSKAEWIQKIRASSAAFTLFTSGTTGRPKRITHPISNFLRSVKQGGKYAHDIWALAYNPTHMAGLQVFFQALLNLNPLIYIFGANKEEALTMMRTYGVTHISATPTFYRLLMPPDFQLTGVRRVTLGGEKSTPALYEQIKKIFPHARITNIYASTEAGALFHAYSDIFQVPDELAPYVRVKNQILYLSRKILGEGNYGPSEWYDTGDMVEVVSEQPLSFRFVSRSNEMLNIGGNKVNPAEVEEVLLQHPKIRNARVYGKPNSVLGYILIADIESDELLDEREIKSYLSVSLQHFKVPRIIRKVEKIQTTRSGKVKRAE